MTPQWLVDYQDEINQTIDNFFRDRYGNSVGVEHDFETAIRYAVEGGGKRLRPILMLIAFEYFLQKSREIQITREEVLCSSIGIEFIHCYTLVHDDLPCMDNDELRRGKPTVWKVYGETMAVLVGDTLQTMGFELLGDSKNAEVVVEIARALGDLGVVRGQTRDTLMLQKDLNLPELLRLHDEKTGIFIASSLVCGSLLGGATPSEIDSIRKFGMLLGRAFQIQDDILDYEGDSTTLGKKAGKDVHLGKGIVASIGIEEAKGLLSEIENNIKEILNTLDDPKFDEIREFVIKRRS